MVCPSAPVLLLPSPWRPRSALCSGLKRNLSSVFSCSSATRTTSPPRPPSPPLGPPRGTYFSLRKARQPLPPSPAFTRIRASSMNIEKPPACIETGGPVESPGRTCGTHAACPASKDVYADAWMLTNLPIRPRSLNSTLPVTLANSVSSLPQPTLRPGLILVPRCRTMMEPPGTSWPPNTFTPRRCAWESRPFLELPKPFLCAMRHLRHNVADLHFGERLAVANGFLVLFLALELEDQDLVAPAITNDGGLQGAAGDRFAAILKGELDGQFDFGADIAGQFFHADDIARSNPVLFSAGFNNRVHANLCLGAGTHGVRRNHWSKYRLYYRLAGHFKRRYAERRPMPGIAIMALFAAALPNAVVLSPVANMYSKPSEEDRKS